jgi:hypothetical protein
MPRLSRQETSLVIAELRTSKVRESHPAQRLLQRLENALSESIEAVREQRRQARAGRAMPKEEDRWPISSQ